MRYYIIVCTVNKVQLAIITVYGDKDTQDWTILALQSIARLDHNLCITNKITTFCYYLVLRKWSNIVICHSKSTKNNHGSLVKGLKNIFPVVTYRMTPELITINKSILMFGLKYFYLQFQINIS